MKKMLVLIVVWAVLAVTSVAHAHSRLVSSSPEDGAHLASAPSMLHLQYNEPVRMLSIELEGDVEGAVDINFSRSRQQNDHVEVALPDLADDRYTVTWTLIGQDGHRVSGTVSFTVATE
ncbi:copper resistance CopC family protein [Aliidiomarina sanyensis]|uniref:Copper resistance protein C n=1 Tax=Aliidiomarina sanyensis TaxID=1249555 RepID=A0A432WPT8_9GAMM|nr:copper resistance CopC family protein [Aliidiomarina sanyensis]RUO35758.1 hypothetical protein CWE11_03095 [Aliidiomarina sanyensis]